MKVNFTDFTTRREVHDHLVNKSSKGVVKVEARLLDEDGVVVEHSDDFLENCGDIKYYFDDDESLEINIINSVALFVRGNGEKVIVDYVEDNDFEPSFIKLINDELGLDFEINMQKYNYSIIGELPGDKFKHLDKELKSLCNKYGVELGSS